MKKIVCVLTLIIALVSTKIHAQEVKFGIRAGLNAADWKGEAVQSAQDLLDLTNGYTSRAMRTGFHAGVYAAIPLSDRFVLEPGVQYSQKGTILRGKFSSEKLDFLNLNATITNKATYLDVPLLAKVYVSEGFHLYAGPQVSFLLSNKVNTRASVVGFNLLNRDFDVTDSFRKLDAAIVGGIGYKFPNGVNLSAGYDYGLSPVDEGGNFKTYNRVIKASIGFEF